MITYIFISWKEIRDEILAYDDAPEQLITSIFGGFMI